MEALGEDGGKLHWLVTVATMDELVCKTKKSKVDCECLRIDYREEGLESGQA